MEVCKLLAATKSYIWGGRKLFEYGKKSEEDTIAESWELSFHPDGLTKIASGADQGNYLKDVAKKEDLGTRCDDFPFFPILIKLIDAKNDLSIQVHPSDEYALKNENSFGKTEMWYVVGAEEGAMLHIGLKETLSKEEFIEKIQNNTIVDSMNHLKVKAGDCYFIPSGTLHAIGKGCFICEIQENSNLTYRVYDYGRVGKDGKPRELHVEKAIRVTNLKAMKPENLQGDVLADCRYFNVMKLVNPKEVKADASSFAALTILSGNGKINDISFEKGDTFFVPAGKKATILGDAFIIQTKI